MNDELLSITAKINSIEDLEKQVKLKTDSGVFNIWKTKKDGNETVSYKGFVSEEIHSGDNAIMRYKVDTYQREGKDIQSKTVTSIGKYRGELIQEPVKENKGTDWDAIAEGKVRHGVAIAFIDKGRELNGETKQEMNKWVRWIVDGDFTSEEVKLDVNIPF